MKLLALPQSIWGQLSTPHASIYDLERRHQSRLLANLTLTTLSFQVISFILIFAGKMPSVGLFNTAAALIFGGSVYMLNRQGYYQIAAHGFVFAFFLVTHLALLSDSYASIFYAALLLLISGVLLPYRTTTALFLGSLIIQVIFLANIPSTFQIESFQPLAFTIFSSIVILIYIRSRVILEQERQAELRKIIATLENSEQTLAYNLERYRVVTELSSDLAYSRRFNPDGTSTHEWITDHALTRLTGYTQEDIQNSLLLYHPEDAALIPEHMRQVFAGETTEYDYRFITKTGELRWFRLRRQPVWDDTHQHVIRFYGVAQDITERKLAEDALRASEERYRIITELISDDAFIYKMNPDGSIELEWGSDRWLHRLTGYHSYEMKRPEVLYHPDEVERVWQDLAKTQKGEPTEGEYRIITKSGESRWLYVRRMPIWDEKEQRVVRFYGAEQDITERKLAEEALRQSEERYRIIAELISDHAFAFLVNPDGSLTREWATDQWIQRSTGYQLSELLNANALFHPSEHDRLLDDMKQVMAGEGTQGEYRIITKSGENRWLHIRRLPVWDEQEGRVVRYYGVEQDITERKNAEERYRIVSELISDYAYSCLVNANGSIEHEWTTESFTRLTGFEAGSAFAVYHPDYLQLAHADTRRTIEGSITENEYQIITKGGDHHWLFIRRLPVWDEREGRVIRFYGVAQDITERKHAEQIVRENEIRLERERARLLADFVQDTAHEFRTPLSVISSTVYLLSRTKDPDQQQQRIEKINFQIDTLVKLLEVMLEVVQLDRVIEIEAQALNLNPLLETLKFNLEARIQAKGHQVEWDLDASMSVIQGDSELLEKAFYHLLDNAIKFTPDSGRIRVITRFDETSVEVRVSDNGIGIGEEALPKVFDYFYREDPARTLRGFGLGLAIAKKIIDLHHGQIKVVSQLEQGSTFTIILPHHATS